MTVTLSDVRQSGGPDQGPYCSRMVITGPGFSTLTYTYQVFGGTPVGGNVDGGWV